MRKFTIAMSILTVMVLFFMVAPDSQNNLPPDPMAAATSSTVNL